MQCCLYRSSYCWCLPHPTVFWWLLCVGCFETKCVSTQCETCCHTAPWQTLSGPNLEACSFNLEACRGGALSHHRPKRLSHSWFCGNILTGPKVHPVPGQCSSRTDSVTCSLSIRTALMDQTKDLSSSASCLPPWPTRRIGGFHNKICRSIAWLPLQLGLPLRKTNRSPETELQVC